jgi:hypothetical protein
VHRRDTRTLADLPWSGYAITWRLRVRKLFCRNRQCPRRIFTERLPGVVRFTLEPLSRAETAELVTAARGRPAERAALAQIYRRSGGNPYFVAEHVPGPDHQTLLREGKRPALVITPGQREQSHLMPPGELRKQHSGSNACHSRHIRQRKENTHRANIPSICRVSKRQVSHFMRGSLCAEPVIKVRLNGGHR